MSCWPKPKHPASIHCPPEQREWVDAPAVGREWPACETLEGEGLANIASSDDDGRAGGSHRQE
uniref:Uncharacterized protein n=1 Tax=Achromobacter denitrificans TaxID=32002 RepID=T2K1A9_ACHDE|nr:hypothetical protein [Achromobacter denitrificans]CCU56621.1 hypothetical protein [Achromobacter denitrificans]